MNRLFVTAALTSLAGCSFFSSVQPDDAGHQGWLREAMPLMLGRQLESTAELLALQQLATTEGRDAVFYAATQDESYVAYWTEVLIDVLHVEREGTLAANPACYRDADLDPSFYEALLDHLATNDPRSAKHAAQWCGLATCPDFTMRDVIRASVTVDRLDVLMSTVLIPMTAHAKASGTRSLTLSNKFMATMLGRDTSCLSCHTSTYSTTDDLNAGENAWDRFYPAMRDGSGAVLDLEGAVLSTKNGDGVELYGGLGDRSADLKGFFDDAHVTASPANVTVAPWGMAESCTTLFADGLLQVAGFRNPASVSTPTGIAGQVRTDENDLFELLGLMQNGVDALYDFRVNPSAAPAPGDTPGNTYQAAWGATYFEGCTQGCHEPSEFMTLVASRPYYVLTHVLENGAGEMPSLCQLQKNGGFTEGGGVNTNAITSGSCPDLEVADGVTPPIPAHVAAGLRWYANAMLQGTPYVSSGSPMVQGSDGTLYPQGFDEGHGYPQDASGTQEAALSLMVANTLVNRVTEEVTGEALVLAHGFPRNEDQADALLELTDAFISEGWSLQAVLYKMLVESQFVGRTLPSATAQPAYSLPPVVNPWASEHPNATFSDDPMCQLVSTLNQSSCTSCHQGNSPSGNLELEGVVTASEWFDVLNPLVVAGNPAASTAYQAVSGALTMPAQADAAARMHAWIDAGALPAALDCDSGRPQSADANDRGDLIHTRSPAGLQSFTAQALWWPAANSFGSAHPEVSWPLPIATQAAMGRYTSSTSPRRKQIAMDMMLAWDGVAGTCAKPEVVDSASLRPDQIAIGAESIALLGPDDWSDWIDVLIAEAQSGWVYATPTIEELLKDLRERILLNRTLPHAERTPLVEVVVAKGSNIWRRAGQVDHNILDTVLRTYCGALLTSPQVLLQGLEVANTSAVTMPGASVSGPVCAPDAPCTESEWLDEWSARWDAVPKD